VDNQQDVLFNKRHSFRSGTRSSGPTVRLIRKNKFKIYRLYDLHLIITSSIYKDGCKTNGQVVVFAPLTYNLVRFRQNIVILNIVSFFAMPL